jgi:hypothetical protein
VSGPRRPETELVRVDSPGVIGQRATRLGPAQSLSVVLTWPKGFVTPPRMGPFARDAWLLAAPALLFVYYLIVWISLGREPAPGSVVVRYDPPAGLSPAAARYVWTTGSDGRTVAAVIAQLAARGRVGIETQDGKYNLTRLVGDGADALAPEEARELETLFAGGPALAIDPRNAVEVNRLLLPIESEMQKLTGVYFTRNLRFGVLGTLVSVVTGIAIALTAHGRDTMGAAFLVWWFFFCATMLGSIVLINLVPAWRRVLRGLGGSPQLLVATGVVLVFLAVFVGLLVQLWRDVSPSFSVMLAALVTINLAWVPALRRLTPRGRETRAALDGFRQFLDKVEQDRMQRLNPTDRAPEAAAGFLPYAIALEVREAWGDHLAEAFFAATTAR